MDLITPPLLRQGKKWSITQPGGDDKRENRHRGINARTPPAWGAVGAALFAWVDRIQWLQ